jgi:diacylglycerol kinase family enzyme
MKVLVVLNPIAGGRDKEEFLAFLKDQFNRYNIDSRIYKTTGQEDETGINRMIESFQPETLLGIGGDGTISISAKCLIDKDIALGIIPFGSANGMARELELSDDPGEALDDFLKSRHYRQLDLYRVNDQYIGMHIGDIGLNARIVEGFEQEKGRGMFSYAKHFLRELSQGELIEFEIELEDQKIKENAYMVAFANARKYGTGVVLNWMGNLFDGKIELVIAKDIKIRTLLLAGMTSFNSELARDDSSDIISVQKARIRTENPVSVQVDGEYIGKLKDVKIEVLPGAVKLVLVNRQNT